MEIKFFDDDGSMRNIRWVKKLLKEGKITRIPSIKDVYNECYGTALDNVDKCYRYFGYDSTLVNEMIRLYEDANIGLAYKKEISRELSDFYYINSYLHQEAKQLEDNKKTHFITHRYGKYMRLAPQIGIFYHVHQNINIIRYLNFFIDIHSFYQKIKTWLLQIVKIIILFLNLAIRQPGNELKEYHHAILVTAPDYQFKFKMRAIDFLLDGKAINKDNTIFLLLNSGITGNQLNEMKSRNLKVLDCSKPLTPGRSQRGRETVHLLMKMSLYAIKVIFLGLFEHNIILMINRVLLTEFLRWSAILQNIKFRHLITLNDVEINHIARNILLNKTGTKTWYYAHSNALGYLYMSLDEDLNSKRHLVWSFLHYNGYIGWNDKMLEYFQLHPQRICEYFSIGCLWSQSIVDILEGRVASNLKQKIYLNIKGNKLKIISFFDTSYLPNSISPMEDGVAFHQSILKLVEELSDIYVLVKEKKAEEIVLDEYKRYYGDTSIFYEEYKPALDTLREHRRCYFTGSQEDPSEIIALSDLTVTCAFSSPTIEALGAKKKAIFFDASNRWKGSCYTLIPNFVAYDYDELKRLIQLWLYKMSEKEHENFLNKYVTKMIDPYVDGKAVTRFRELLLEPIRERRQP